MKSTSKAGVAKAATPAHAGRSGAADKRLFEANLMPKRFEKRDWETQKPACVVNTGMKDETFSEKGVA